MGLTLTATKYPELDVGGNFAVTKRFDHNGGTIGHFRGRDRDQADWQLPKPHYIISTIHAIIDHQSGKYWIIDVSANGTIVNGETLSCDVHQISDDDNYMIGRIEFRSALDDITKRVDDSSSNYEMPTWIQDLINTRSRPCL